MKKLLASLLAVSAIAASAGSSFNSPGGLEFRFGGLFPSEDYWDDAAGGLDAGFVFWGQDGTLGLWIGAGIEVPTLEWNNGERGVDTDLEVVPVGASILLRGELAPNIALRAEAGARYVFLDVEDDPGYYDHRGHYHYDHRYDSASRDLDVDDTAFASFSLALELNLQPIVLAVGGGYQLDCIEPTVSYAGEDFADIDLSGPFAFVNLGIAF